MVRQRCYSRGTARFHIANDDERIQVLQRLEALGLVECMDRNEGHSAWAITGFGSRCLTQWKRVDIEQPMFDVRPDSLAAKDRTKFETIQMLLSEEHSWTLQRFPPAKIPIAYNLEDPNAKKIFYVKGPRTPAGYFTCLLQCSKLRRLGIKKYPMG